MTNELIFTSRLFRLGLWLLDIRHQRIDKGCPWMNGRIERFFGTLKEKLNQWEVDSLQQLNGTLGQFRMTCKDALIPQAQGCAGAVLV